MKKNLTGMSLESAFAEREDLLLGQRIDSMLLHLGHKDVTPAERLKLKSLLKYYAEKPHPFTACVRDNTKRFGPDRVKLICATLKDIIMGDDTHWRHGGGKKSLSEEQLDFDVISFLENVTDSDLEQVVYGT